eukprot:350594-Chlamydomonas_euryale.AAC.9
MQIHVPSTKTRLHFKLLFATPREGLLKLCPHSCVFLLLLCRQHLAQHDVGAPQPALPCDEQIGCGSITYTEAHPLCHHGGRQEEQACLWASPEGMAQSSGAHSPEGMAQSSGVHSPEGMAQSSGVHRTPRKETLSCASWAHLVGGQR